MQFKFLILMCSCHFVQKKRHVTPLRGSAHWAVRVGPVDSAFTVQPTGRGGSDVLLWESFHYSSVCGSQHKVIHLLFSHDVGLFQQTEDVLLKKRIITSVWTWSIESLLLKNPRFSMIWTQIAAGSERRWVSPWEDKEDPWR